MKTVVYIDDEPMICRLVERILTRLEVDVRTFVSPEEAVAYVQEHPPALVICDYRMPTMNGLEVFAALGSEAPFVLISGDLQVHDAADSGVTEVVAKPIRPEELMALVRRLL